MSNGRSIFFPTLKPMEAPLIGTALERRHQHWEDAVTSRGPAKQDYLGKYHDIQQTSEAMGLEHDPGESGTEAGYTKRVVDSYLGWGGKDLGPSFRFSPDDPSSMALEALGPALRPFLFDHYNITGEVRSGLENIFSGMFQRFRETPEEFAARSGGLQQLRLKAPGVRPGVVPNFADRKNLTGKDVLKISANVLGLTLAELMMVAPGPSGVMKATAAKVLLSGLRRRTAQVLGKAASRSYRAGAHLGLRPGATPLVETAMESTEGMPGAARFAIAAGAGLLGDPSGTSVIRGIASGAKRGFEGAGGFALTKASRIPSGRDAAQMQDRLRRLGKKLSAPGVARRQTKQEELNLYTSLVENDTAMRRKLRDQGIPSGPTIPEAVRDPNNGGLIHWVLGDGPGRGQIGKSIFPKASVTDSLSPGGSRLLDISTKGGVIDALITTLDPVVLPPISLVGKPLEDLLEAVLVTQGPVAKDLVEGMLARGIVKVVPTEAAGSIEQIGIRSVDGQLVIRVQGITDKSWDLLTKIKGVKLDKPLRVDKDIYDLRIKIDDGGGAKRVGKVFTNIDASATKAGTQAVSPPISADVVKDAIQRKKEITVLRNQLAPLDTKWEDITQFIKQFDDVVEDKRLTLQPEFLFFRVEKVVEMVRRGKKWNPPIKAALKALGIGRNDFDVGQLNRLRAIVNTVAAERQMLLKQIDDVTPGPALLNAMDDVARVVTIPGEDISTAILKSTHGTAAIVESATRRFFEVGSKLLVAKGWKPIVLDQDALRETRALATKWRKLKPDNPQRTAVALQYRAAAARIAPDSDELRLLEALYDGGWPPAKYAEIFEDLQEAILTEARDMAFIDPAAAIPRLFDNPKTFRGIWDDLGPGFEVPSTDWKNITEGLWSPGSFRDWLSKGYVPAAGGNPYHIFATRRLAGIKYRGLMRLAYRAQANGLAKTQEEFLLLSAAEKKQWRVPDIGAPFNSDVADAGPVTGDAIETVFKGSREIYVPVKLAGDLEYAAGKQAKLIAPGGLNIMKPMAFTANFLKAVKLQLSLFQAIDFQMRSSYLAFTPSEILRGTPLKLPSLLGRALWAQINPNSITHIRAVMKADPVMTRVLRFGLETTDQSVLQGVYESGTLMMRKLGEEGASLIDKMPTPQARGVLRRIQKASEYFQNRLFEAVYPTYQHWAVTEVIVPALRRAHKGLSEDQIASMAATETGKLFSSLASWETVLRSSPGFSAILRQLIFSTNETEALLKQGFSVFKGPNKSFWANYYAGFFIFNSMMGNAIHYWATGKPLPAEAYIPIVIAPKYGGPVAFASGFFRPTIPKIEGRGGSKLVLDLAGQTDTVLRIAAGPLTALKSRLNVLPAAVYNQIKGASFNNTPAEGFVGKMRMAGEDLFYPISIGSWVGAFAPKAFLGAEERLGKSGNIFQASGFGVTAERTDQFLDRLTIDSGFMNMSTKLPATSYGELWPSQKRKMKENFPKAFAELRTRREIQAKRGDEYAEAIIKSEEADEKQVRDLNALGVEASKNGMAAQTFLRRASDIQTDLMGQKRSIFDLFEDEEDRDLPEDKYAKARALIFKVFSEIDPVGSFRRDEAQLEIQRLAESEGWDQDILNYLDENLGLAPKGLNKYMQGFFDGKKLLREHGWWDLYKKNPLFTSSPKLLARYEKWLDLGRSNQQMTLLRTNPGLYEMMRFLDKAVDIQKNEYQKANPEIDKYLVTYRGSNPRTPLGRAAKLLIPGAEPFTVLRRRGGRTLSTDNIQKLLAAQVTTLEDVANMTDRQVRVILGQGFIQDELPLQAANSLAQIMAA